MQLETLQSKLNSMPLGANQVIEYSHEVKLPKALSNHTLIKSVLMVVRIGVAYSNMQAVQNKGGQVQSLPYGQWLKGFENIILTHKGENYLRVSKSSMEFNHTTTYLLDNNQVVSEKWLIDNGYIKSRNGEMLVFNVNIKHIKKLGK